MTKIHTIAQFWEQMEVKLLNAGYPPNLVSAFEETFFAGAHSSFHILSEEIARLPEEKATLEIQKLKDELEGHHLTLLLKIKKARQ